MRRFQAEKCLTVSEPRRFDSYAAHQPFRPCFLEQFRGFRLIPA